MKNLRFAVYHCFSKEVEVCHITIVSMKNLRFASILYIYYIPLFQRKGGKMMCTIVSVKTLRVGVYRCFSEDIEGWCVPLFE